MSLVILFMVTACQSNPSEIASSPISTPVSPVEPEPAATIIPTPTLLPPDGQAAMRGTFITFQQDRPLMGATVYLIPAMGEDSLPPAIVGSPADDAIKTRTDDTGTFIFESVPPGDYYIAYFNAPQWFLFGEVRGIEIYPIRFTLEADQPLELGVQMAP